MTMALYTFDCRRSNDSPICLEAHELSSDDQALAWARKMMTEHLTCSTIEVFEGERLVGGVARAFLPGKGPDDQNRVAADDRAREL